MNEINELPEPTVPWISDKDFEIENPIMITIKDVDISKGKYGADVNVTFNTMFGERRMTFWGGNYNFVVNTHGRNKASWIGKQHKLRQEKLGNVTVRTVF